MKPLYIHYFLVALYPIGSILAFGYFGQTLHGAIAVFAIFLVCGICIRFNRCPNCRKSVSYIPFFKIGDHTVNGYSPIIPSECTKCGTNLG